MFDRKDVGPGSRKGNLIEEGGAVGRGGIGHPLEDVAAAGIVVGKGEGDGIVGGLVAAEHFAQVPGASHGVGKGIDAVFVIEGGNVLGVGPFAGGVFADLHQADFLGGATRARVEPALAPDNGFHKGRVDAVALGGGADGDVLAAFESAEPPDAQGPGGQKAEEEEGDAQAEFTAAHGPTR